MKAADRLTYRQVVYQTSQLLRDLIVKADYNEDIVLTIEIMLEEILEEIRSGR